MQCTVGAVHGGRSALGSSPGVITWGHHLGSSSGVITWGHHGESAPRVRKTQVSLRVRKQLRNGFQYKMAYAGARVGIPWAWLFSLDFTMLMRKNRVAGRWAAVFRVSYFEFFLWRSAAHMCVCARAARSLCAIAWPNRRSIGKVTRFLVARQVHFLGVADGFSHVVSKRRGRCPCIYICSRSASRDASIESSFVAIRAVLNFI
jgi:hypothetical protein